MAKNYKITLCSNRRCKHTKKIVEKYTFVAPLETKESEKTRASRYDTTIIARFCSMACKVEWLRNEYNRNEQEYHEWIERIKNQPVKIDRRKKFNKKWKRGN